MVRLFHTSDTHLGLQQFARTDANGLNQKEQDIAAAFHAVIDHALAERPDLFVHAGDLFDGVRPGNRALAQAMEGFLRLSRHGIPTFVIAGNHEHPKLRETGSPMRLFSHLPNVHVAYQGRAETTTLTLQPQLNAGGHGGPAPQARASGPVTVHAVPQCADNEDLARQVASLRRGPGPNILIVHGAVSTLRAFSHAEFNEQGLDPVWFDSRFDYVALGHYHATQSVTPRAWYCGAPERVSMAEAGEAKGFLDVELQVPGATQPPKEPGRDPAARANQPLVHLAEKGAPALGASKVTATFRPIAGRTYADLPSIDASSLEGPEVLERARRVLGRLPQGAVARLRIEGLRPALRASLDVRALRQAGAHLLNLDLALAWSDQGVHVRGAHHVGGLAEEFEAFAGRQPLDGVDRDALLQACKTLLTEAP